MTQATLKVVGAFHGLSRERSDARKYPAIHPIDSWSKYRGVVDMERVEQARSILKRSNEINQMMKVIGEEGTSAEDYIVYQKGELLDAVYLQQNSFDPIDAACDPDRQIHEFNVLYDVLTRDFALSDKKEIRAFFNQVRQEFLDWHNTVFRTPEFEAQEKRLKDFYLSKADGLRGGVNMQKVYTKIESIVGNVVTVRASGVRNGDLALVGDSYANVIKLDRDLGNAAGVQRHPGRQHHGPGPVSGPPHDGVLLRPPAGPHLRRRRCPPGQRPRSDGEYDPHRRPLREPRPSVSCPTS